MEVVGVGNSPGCMFRVFNMYLFTIPFPILFIFAEKVNPAMN